MKVSVSIPEDDVAFLDDYVRNRRAPSRSAALQRAIRLLRAAELSDDYAAAFDEWAADADNDGWDTTIGDGLTHDRPAG